MVNLPTIFYDTAIVNARIAEVPEADFVEGANRAASNGSGIGINSGFPDPKETDWPREPVTGYRAESGYIGIDSGANNVVSMMDTDQTIFGNAAFGPADALTAPDDVITASLGQTNQTGADIEAGAWAWGPIV